MAASDVEAVLEFLRKNGFSEAESALRVDIVEKNELGSFDFERFFFPMVPPPPPLRIPASYRRSECLGDGGVAKSSSISSDDEFVSMGSSTYDLCSSEFVNPYGVRSTSRDNSEASSDGLSQFGTAPDYHDLDLQNDQLWYDYDDNNGENFMTSSIEGPDLLGGPSEDKFVMSTSETDKRLDDQLILDKPCLFHVPPVNNDGTIHFPDQSHVDKASRDSYSCPFPFCKTAFCDQTADISFPSLKETGFNGFQLNVVRDITTDCDFAPQHDYSIDDGSKLNMVEGFKRPSDFHFKVEKKKTMPNGNDGFDVGYLDEEQYEEAKADVDGEDAAADDELPMFNPQEDEYEVFDLRIIHRKNRTGFEENKEVPIVLNSLIAGRYYVTEYLGSAAFSRVVQAHDLCTGIDVCLKIIKNDKDFFDQSLDEIKLLKFVNKHDPADKYHILRLYDYFYHQEHLFIVCELLRANLYEFQKFNQESGGEAYFTLSRLQVITRQCLEALEYLHDLGVIHCDLKPENILIKSYKRCEIKVIDLGSSCFQSDNLCLYVQSRSYRAPEVILGLPYDQKIDMWSLGCILAELCSGEVLFPNDAVVIILARMIGMLGRIDMEMLLRGQETHKYFTREYDLYFINEETDQLEYLIPGESSLEHHLQVRDDRFIDFLGKLLEINPKRRPTAKEALKHPWVSQLYDHNSY